MIVWCGVGRVPLEARGIGFKSAVDMQQALGHMKSFKRGGHMKYFCGKLTELTAPETLEHQFNVEILKPSQKMLYFYNQFQDIFNLLAFHICLVDGYMKLGRN